MGSTKRKKTYEVSREGFITVHPSLHENKEKGKLRLILKRLIQLRKGHRKLSWQKVTIETPNGTVEGIAHVIISASRAVATVLTPNTPKTIFKGQHDN